MFKRVLKYAAIFIIAFALSWFINDLINNKSIIDSNQYTKVEVSYGSKSNIELPDGSHVTLNSGSFIRYPNNFKRKKREIYFEGEAFFDVKKNIKRPFVVKTSDIQIKVLGTQFNVKAYPDEKKIETTLVRGEVEVFYRNKESNKDEKILLQPNHKLVIQKSYSTNEISKHDSTGIQEQLKEKELPKMEYVSQTDLFTSWKDNKLVFNNERFEDLTNRFERWFDVIIVNNYADIKSARLSGQFEKETIEQALDAMILTVPFQYTIEKNVITIYPKNK